MMRRGPVVLTLVVAFAVATEARQVAQPQPTFRARTDLVRVEVVVVDEQGQPIRDLKESDFQLFERRKPQPIALFNPVSGEGRPAPEPIRHTAGPRDVATNASSRASAFIILVLDDMVVRS